MRLKTIPEAARELGWDIQRFRRRVQSGGVPRYVLGGRTLVDVDEAARILGRETGSISLQDASALTGLAETILRRAAQAGEIPSIRVGRGIRFVPAELLAAIEETRQE